ncbi:MAG: helix-turn-helix domain-containing protein [Deltaproteobacteria bacterium]|nr:helix-turn-helix domain-containing protein [Deltaproteobacteria bacterium]
MTAIQLRHTLKRLGLSQRQFAFRLKLDVGTVNRWATGRRDVPEAVALLLDCWRRDGVPARPTARRKR